MTKHEEAMAAAADKAAEHVAALSMGDKPGGAEGSAPGVPAGAAPAAAASRIVGAAAADTTHGLSPADAGVASGLPGYIADEDANLGTFIANREY